MAVNKDMVTYEFMIRVLSAEIVKIEILKGVLTRLGVGYDQIVECEQWPYTRLSVFLSSGIKAKALRKKLRGFALKGIRTSIKFLKRNDWQTKWKRDFKPLVLTPVFGVVPMWLKKKYRPRGRVAVYIDTTLAFGTGMHATTRFMAGLVERCQRKVASLLDVGTGSGILAIVAAKCGIKDVTAVDISPDAVATAKINFMENDCPWIKVKAADIQEAPMAKQYDFVCANIITQDLIRMGERIVSLVKPGKYLAVSGISEMSYPVFRQAYARYPLKCLKVEKGDGWTAVLYKKSA
jgi:ribosomal protein L11 methyltransferase